MSESQTPLARLVLFLVCLSVAGTFVAGIHYVAVDRPQQQAVTVPANYSRDCCQLGTCLQDMFQCESRCNGNGSCRAECFETYHQGGIGCGK